MNKMSIAELLKNCPKDMELDCTMYEDVYFDYVDELNIIHCYIQHETCKTSLILNQDGTPNSILKSKCVIYPKGKTTWEGFQIPFKDGDIVFYNDTIAIFKEWGDETLFRTYVTKYLCCDFMIDKNVPLVGKNVCKKVRLATEKEREKLFNAIKDNGYRWNPETKTLEKLIEPKFKVGDVIQDIDAYKVTITEVNVEDECYEYESMIAKGIGGIAFSEQDNWQLVPVVQKFEVGDKIKKKGDTRLITIKDVRDSYYIITIPDYFDNRYITDKLSFSNQDEYELVPIKFDISNLEPFDKVLVRQNVNGKWGIDFFGFYTEGFYYTTGSAMYVQCVPYKGNEHLRGTTNDCDDFYKTW